MIWMGFTINFLGGMMLILLLFVILAVINDDDVIWLIIIILGLLITAFPAFYLLYALTHFDLF